MKISLQREELLAPLQDVIGVVDRNRTMPVLANVLIDASDRIQITGTDCKVELRSEIHVGAQQSGKVTLNGRKLVEILKNLPAECTMTLATEGAKVTLKAGRNRFTLPTLPAADFPLTGSVRADQAIVVEQSELLTLIQRTSLAMAKRDVRYYLVGLLLETDTGILRAVATDGIRLAASETCVHNVTPGQQVIIPADGVAELQRLLTGTGPVELRIADNNLRVQIGDVMFTCQLIDAKYPEWQRVVPTGNDSIMTAGRDDLLMALRRAAIASNDKNRGVRLSVMTNGTLAVNSTNTQGEEVDACIEVDYQGGRDLKDLEFCVNVELLSDIIEAIDHEKVVVEFQDGSTAALIHALDVTNTRYVCMPVRL